MGVAAEAFAADGADVAFLSGVQRQVGLQVAATQALVADGAAHVLAVLVSEHMCDELLSLGERLRAEGTAERSVRAALVQFLAGAEVALEVERAHEALTAAVTDDDRGQVALRTPGRVLQEGLVHYAPCDVRAQVQPQGVPAGEASVTHAAHEGLDSVVEHHVPPDVALLPEAPAAHRAAEGPHPRVDEHVVLQHRHGFEALTTH